MFAVLGWLITLLFAACFFAVWMRWRTLKYLPMLAFGFIFQGIGQFFVVLRSPHHVAAVSLLSCVFYTAAAFCVVDGATSRLAPKRNNWVQLTIAGLILLGFSFFYWGIDNYPMRICVENYGFGVMFLFSAWEMRLQARRPADRILLWVMVVFGLHFFPRVLLTIHSVGPQYDAEVFFQSSFWLWLNLAVILFAVTMGLTLLSTVASDVVAMLMKDATTDGLTGLVNRREFERIAEQRFRWAGNIRTSSLLLCDVDHFKSINDTYGHSGGDAALRRVAEVLSQNIRGGDSAARIGGEEFALLLPGMNALEACGLAERLRFALEEYRFMEPELATLHVTASFGVTERRGSETPQETIHRADRALYNAKRSGRNCVRTDVEEVGAVLQTCTP